MSSFLERTSGHHQLHNHPGGKEVFESMTKGSQEVKTGSDILNPSPGFFTIIGVGVISSILLDRKNWKSKAVAGLSLIAVSKALQGSRPQPMPEPQKPIWFD